MRALPQTAKVTFDRPVNGITLSFDRGNTGEISLIDDVAVGIENLINSRDAVFTTTNAVTGGSGAHIVQDGGSGGNFYIIEIDVDSNDVTTFCFAGDTDIAAPRGRTKGINAQGGRSGGAA